MEKRCIQCIWNLMNRDTILFNRTVKHSLSMSSTTLGENIPYFMFKLWYLFERMVRTYKCASSSWDNSKAHIKRNIHCQ